MTNFDKFLWFFPKGVLFENLRSKELQEDFLSEINFINFQRLKTILFIVFGIISIMLFFDFKSSEIWDKTAINRFKILDVSILTLLLLPIYVCYFRPPENKQKLNRLHIITTKVSIFNVIIWAAIVSANEYSTGAGMPTYVITVFVICSIFIFRGSFIIGILVTSLATLYIFLFLFNISNINLIHQYLSSIFMVIIAIIISKILMITNIKAFSAKKDLEKTNASLDEIVKARTRELTLTNELLKVEINEREKYEQQLQKEKERAEEADRLKSSFLANMSHEIRTPLNGIVGFSDLMQTTGLTEDKRHKYADILKKNSHQLLKIIDDIIDISMIESNQLNFKFSVTTIKQILDSSIDFFKTYQLSIKDKNVEFENINLLPNSDVEMYTDPFRVQQVIYNLLNNAFKFTEAGSIKLISRLDDNEVLFCIEDTGIGIKPEKSEIIFERFMQVSDTDKKSFGGTGLGLSISTGIVQALNGNIWLDYTYTGGARFCFTIPLKRPLRKVSAGEKLKIDNKLSVNKHILIVSQSDLEFLFLKKLFDSEEITRKNIFSEQNHNEYDIAICSNIDAIQFKNISSLENNNCVFFYIFDNYSEFQLARKLGCKYCYPSPFNLNKFIKDISSVLSIPAAKS